VQIATKIAPDVRDAIRETPLADSKRDLLDLARLELADQRAVVRVLNKGGAKRVKQAYRKVRQQKVARQAKDAPPLPDRRYRCLVIDPPWPVEKILRDVRPKQQEWDYPTMTVDEIAELPIRSLAEESGCHVYLWVTHRFLPDGLRLFERWGVKYQCLLTWVKNVGITPYSWMYSTEHVLFGRIGSLDLMKVGMRLDFAADRREHSRKPEVFYDIVRQVSPGPRLDMFAREAHDGFEQWGNETNRFSATSAGKLAQ
jgi:N6-adenosine-specific RNA methylase IME4